PLCALVDGVLQIGEVAAEVDVLPFGVAADGACAPETESAAFEEAEAVDAQRIQDVLLRLVEHGFEIDGEVDYFVGRRLVDGAVDIVAGVDAADETAGRQVDLDARHRIEDGDPRVVEGGVGGVDAGAHSTDIGDAL